MNERRKEPRNNSKALHLAYYIKRTFEQVLQFVDDFINEEENKEESEYD